MFVSSILPEPDLVGQLHVQKLQFFGNFFPCFLLLLHPSSLVVKKIINIIVACFHHHGFSIVFYKYIIVSIIVSILVL